MMLFVEMTVSLDGKSSVQLPVLVVPGAPAALSDPTQVSRDGRGLVVVPS